MFINRNEALSNRRPDINPDFAGIYPFDWVGDDVASFKALQGGLLVAPILQKLILNRYPIVSVHILPFVLLTYHKSNFSALKRKLWILLTRLLHGQLSESSQLI